jgi:hypothetical protein
MRTHAIVRALVAPFLALFISGCVASAPSWSAPRDSTSAPYTYRRLYVAQSEAPPAGVRTAHADSPLSRRLVLRSAH